MLLIDIEKRYVEGLSLLYGKREAENIFYLLAQDKLDWSKCEIGDRQGQELSEPLEQYFLFVLEELKTSKPLQYILHKAYFYDLEFYVDSNVLIPRPETEELVHWIVQDFKALPAKGLDIGVGSGCIPITLDLELDQLKMYGVDVSNGAIQVSKQNNENLNASVEFVQKNVFDTDFKGMFYDLSFIVSNPPYITEGEFVVMQDNVLKYEPELALFAEGDALGFYRRIADLGKDLLKDQGHLYFELNEYNAQEVVNILEERGYDEIILRQDLQGKDRMIRAKMRK